MAIRILPVVDGLMEPTDRAYFLSAVFNNEPNAPGGDAGSEPTKYSVAYFRCPMDIDMQG